MAAGDHVDMLHSTASFLGVFIGGVTFTGSLAAYRKLANLYKDVDLNMPMAGLINKPIVAINALAMASMIKNPSLGVLMLS